MSECTISIEEYKSLIETAQRYEMLVNALLDSSKLDYRDEYLGIYAERFSNTLLTLEHDSFTARLHELQAAKGEE